MKSIYSRYLRECKESHNVSTGISFGNPLVCAARNGMRAAMSIRLPGIKRYTQTLTLGGLLSCVSTLAFAQDTIDLEQLEAEISKRLPDLTVSSISETPLAGMYELISNGQIYYVGSGGRFIIDGNMIDLESRTNLTSERLGSIHIGLINEMDEEQMLIYKPENDTGRSITVFTDTSCGYCRKLHEEIDTFLDQGVAVRYLLFPRAGLNSPSHQNLESVWCSDDPLDAMTTVKAGGAIPGRTCNNPIESHMALAEQVGLRGTPLIYLDTGQQIPGYRAAHDLIQMVKAGEPHSGQ